MKTSCPHCNQHVEADDQWAGQVVACPTCKGQIVLPAAASPRPLAAPPLLQPNYTEQFAKDKGSFLKGQSLRDWEQAALRSYGALANIRQSLIIFFVLLALNVIGRLIFMSNVSPGMQADFAFDFFGFTIVGVLALITFFTPRWWMVLTTAIAIFPFALGIITGIMAVGFLCMIPMLKRANQELYLSASDYDAMKATVSEIATGEQAVLWPEIGKLANNPVRVRFFDNAAVFLLGKKPFNTILTTDASQCVIEVTKKAKKFLKQWPIQGKVKKTNIPLTDEGHTRLQEWLTKAGTPAEAVGA
jgi:hypothetical protein